MFVLVALLPFAALAASVAVVIALVPSGRNRGLALMAVVLLNLAALSVVNALLG